MSEHHDLDIWPEPRKKTPLYINEPWLVDASYDYIEQRSSEPEGEEDNIRIYVPVDLNAEAILRRLRSLVYRYGEANEDNESDFSCDVSRLVSQIEIYDQVWFARGGKFETDADGRITGHSDKAKSLVRRFVDVLKEIPDGCAESFPFEIIRELEEDYLKPRGSE